MMNPAACWNPSVSDGHEFSALTGHVRLSGCDMWGRFAVLFSLAIIGHTALVTPSQAQDPAAFFTEDFNSEIASPNLVGYENFTVANGVIRSDGAISNHNDRRYLRSVVSDYNTRDFRYELTFTTSLQNE